MVFGPARKAMPSKHLLDAEIAPLIEQLPPIKLERESLVQARAMMAEMMPPPPPPPPDIEVREVSTPGRDGAPDVRLIVTAPKGAGQDRPGILHIHGGGYVMGGADSNVVADMMWAQAL